MVHNKIKVNGTRRIKIRFKNCAAKKRQQRQMQWHFVKMKFSDNWSACIFDGDRFLSEMSMDACGKSMAFYSDHGSYSHIPHWLLIVPTTSNTWRLRRNCVDLPHIDPDENKIDAFDNIFTNYFTRKCLRLVFNSIHLFVNETIYWRTIGINAS